MPSSVQPESDDVEVEIEATDDLHASSAAPRHGVGGEVEGADSPRASSEAPHEGDPRVVTELPQNPTAEGAEDPKTAEDEEAARYQRFCRLAEQLVPHKNMWSTVYHPPIDFFAADELPFEQKRLFCWGWELWDSLMFECIASMATVLMNMFTLYTFIVRKQFSDTEYTEETNWVDAGVTIALMLCPLLFGLASIPVMVEHPARLLLYYRLWEQKIVIDFKERGLKDRATRTKVGLIVLAIAGYLLYGWASEAVTDRWTHTWVVLQSLGGMGLAVYKILAVTPFLQDTNGSFKHYQGIDKEKKDARPHMYRDRAAKAIEQIQFIPESQVKYDILAIQAYDAKVLATIRKAIHANGPAEKAAVTQCQEEGEWLKVLGMWIGRLGNSKASYMTRWGSNNDFSTGVSFNVRGFVSSQLYNDGQWHAAGSFGGKENITGSTRALSKFTIGVIVAIFAIEIYGMASAAS
jgi:hypothetical protein